MLLVAGLVYFLVASEAPPTEGPAARSFSYSQQTSSGSGLRGSNSGGTAKYITPFEVPEPLDSGDDREESSASAKDNDVDTYPESSDKEEDMTPSFHNTHHENYESVSQDTGNQDDSEDYDDEDGDGDEYYDEEDGDEDDEDEEEEEEEEE